MKNHILIGLAAVLLGACVTEVPQEDVYRQIAALEGGDKQGVIIVNVYPAIKPEDVTFMFGFPDTCSNLKDVGVILAWGKKEQSNADIIAGLRRISAKHGADIVSYEFGVGSADEIDRILREPTEYTMMRCK